MIVVDLISQDSSKPSCLKTKLWANLITLMNEILRHIVYLCAFLGYRGIL